MSIVSLNRQLAGIKRSDLGVSSGYEVRGASFLYGDLYLYLWDAGTPVFKRILLNHFGEEYQVPLSGVLDWTPRCQADFTGGLSGGRLFDFLHFHDGFELVLYPDPMGYAFLSMAPVSGGLLVDGVALGEMVDGVFEQFSLNQIKAFVPVGTMKLPVVRLSEALVVVDTGIGVYIHRMVPDEDQLRMTSVEVIDLPEGGVSGWYEIFGDFVFLCDELTRTARKLSILDGMSLSPDISWGLDLGGSPYRFYANRTSAPRRVEAVIIDSSSDEDIQVKLFWDVATKISTEAASITVSGEAAFRKTFPVEVSVNLLDGFGDVLPEGSKVLARIVTPEPLGVGALAAQSSGPFFENGKPTNNEVILTVNSNGECTTYYASPRTESQEPYNEVIEFIGALDLVSEVVEIARVEFSESPQISAIQSGETQVSSDLQNESSVGYSIEVQEGTSELGIVMDATGDADLIVRYGSPPTLDDFDYYPMFYNFEELSILNPTAGTWYILVYAFEDVDSVSLTATIYPTLEETTLTSGNTVTGLSAYDKAAHYFKLDVPQDALDVVIDVADNSGGTYTFRIYAKWGSRPSYDDCDDFVYNSGGPTVSFSPSTLNVGQTLYLMVTSYYYPFSDLSITANITQPAPVVSLTEGIPESLVGLQAGNYNRYSLEAPSYAESFLVILRGSSGISRLYLDKDAAPVPDGSSYVRRHDPAYGNETSWIEQLSSNPTESFRGITVEAETDLQVDADVIAGYAGSDVPIVLSNDVAQNVPFGGKYGYERFSIDVPSGQTLLEVESDVVEGSSCLYISDDVGVDSYNRLYDTSGTSTKKTKISVFDPAAMTYYIGMTVKGTDYFLDGSVKAVYSLGSVSEAMMDGYDSVSLNNLVVGATSWQHFLVTVPVGLGILSWHVNSPSYVDLYMRFGAYPDQVNYDENYGGTNFTISVSNPTSGTWYLSVFNGSANPVTLYTLDMYME